MPHVLFSLATAAALLLDTSPADTTARRLRAAPVDNGAIRVDGRLTETAWQAAEPASGFVQREPVEGAPASGRTEVRVLYDGEALYIGARMESADPRGVRALVTRRDREGSSEQLIVSLDTYLDRRTAYTFAITPAGVRIDYYHPADFEWAREYSFDPVWKGEATIDASGWTAELRIPFSQLRFNARSDHVWGINLARAIPASNEIAYWILVPRAATGWASRFGELHGLSGIRPSRRLELTPYVASSSRLRHVDDPRNPFAARQTTDVNAGGEVKMGLGPGLTLDATFNPDFGQVEADPAEVNLSAFETFFDERRPFFVEGAPLFESNAGYFYSRRIGAPPRVSPDADYADELRRTTILGAAKVTGRLPSGLSIGVLGALTDREYARFADTAYVTTDSDGAPVTVPARRGRVVVAPRAAFGVARVQQQFGAHGSTAGLMVTAVRRDVADDGPASETLTRSAYAGGVDWRLRWGGGEYDWSGHAGYSHVAGAPEALSELQLSSRHYYQRPDAPHVAFDPLRTTLSGFTANTGASKLAGNWRWDVDLFTETPGLELNDAGRLGAADDIDFFGRLHYRHTAPGRLFHSWRAGMLTHNSWSYAGIRNSSFVELNTDFTFKNFWELDSEVWLRPRSLSDWQTRGGPLMQTGRRVGTSLNLESAQGDRTQWEIGGSYERDELGGWAREAELELTLRPGTQLEIRLEPRYGAERDTRQYVTTIDRASGSTTFGKRYVFASIFRSELALRGRVNYAVTPDLTIESYLEPFASSGRYDRFGELPAPRERSLRWYGTGATAISRNNDASYTVSETFPSGAVEAFTLSNPDFNFLSFRSNLVLRWEWRPGSTLFVVWQQDRQEDDGIARPARPAQLWRALETRGANVFAVKLSYWLPVP